MRGPRSILFYAWLGLGMEVLLVLGVIVFVLLGAAYQSSAITALHERAQRMQLINLTLQNDFLGTQRALRGYQATRQDRFLQTFYSGQDGFVLELALLRRLAWPSVLDGVTAQAQAARATFLPGDLAVTFPLGSKTARDLFERASASADVFIRQNARLLEVVRESSIRIRQPVPDIRRHSLAWQAGFTGIGYNAQATRRPVTSMTDLLTAPDLHGRVSLVADMRDVMGLILLDMGSDPSDFSTSEFDAALTMLSRSVAAGQIRIVTDYYLPELTKGTVAAGVAWAGDILFGREENPHLQFTWPKGGGMLWTDNMVIPAYARHKENAERLMNFYYRPEVAAQLTAYERYICPVLGTQAAMQRVDPALRGPGRCAGP